MCIVDETAISVTVLYSVCVLDETAMSVTVL